MSSHTCPWRIAKSCGDWGLKKTIAVWLPRIITGICVLSLRCTVNHRWCFASQRLMNPILVVVLSKGLKFLLKVVCIPKKGCDPGIHAESFQSVVPISRSTKGCDVGVCGMLLISTISIIRKLACHW